MNYWWDTWDSMSVVLESELIQSAVWRLHNADIVLISADQRKQLITYDCANIMALRQLYQAVKNFPANINIRLRSEKKGHMPYRVVFGLTPSVVNEFELRYLRDISERCPNIMDKIVLLTPTDSKRRSNMICLDYIIDAPQFYTNYKIDVAKDMFTLNGLLLPLRKVSKIPTNSVDYKAVFGIDGKPEDAYENIATQTKITKLQSYIEMARKSETDVAKPAVCIMCYPPTPVLADKEDNDLFYTWL